MFNNGNDIHCCCCYYVVYIENPHFHIVVVDNYYLVVDNHHHHHLVDYFDVDNHHYQMYPDFFERLYPYDVGASDAAVRARLSKKDFFLSYKSGCSLVESISICGWIN